MCLDSINWALWVRFHGRYWYQSFIDGSNIWGVDRTDPWGPEMDHPPLGRSYLVVVLSFDMSCTLILLTGLYGWVSMADIDINPSSMGPIFVVWIGPTLGVPKWTIRHWAVLFGRSAVVWLVIYLDSLNWALCVRFHGRYWHQSFIDGSNIWGVNRTNPWGPEMNHPPLGRSYLVVVPSYDMSCTLISQLFGSSAVVWCGMCLDSLNWALWVRFHGRYWYQSFIDGSNIWGVERTDPWGPEMDHPPLGRSCLVVVPSYDVSCALIFLTGL